MDKTIQGGILFASMKKWASKNKDLKYFYKTASKRAFDIARASFIGFEYRGVEYPAMLNFKPVDYVNWWSRYSMVYSDVPAVEQKCVHEIMYKFLSEYSMGRLKDEQDTEKKSRKKSTS